MQVVCRVLSQKASGVGGPITSTGERTGKQQEARLAQNLRRVDT